MCCKKEKNDVNKYVLQGKKGKVLPLVSFFFFFNNEFVFS